MSSTKHAQVSIRVGYSLCSVVTKTQFDGRCRYSLQPEVVSLGHFDSIPLYQSLQWEGFKLPNQCISIHLHYFRLSRFWIWWGLADIPLPLCPCFYAEYTLFRLVRAFASVGFAGTVSLCSPCPAYSWLHSSQVSCIPPTFLFLPYDIHCGLILSVFRSYLRFVSWA